MASSKRIFQRREAHRGYGELPQVDQLLYDKLSDSANSNIIKQLTVAKKSGLAWEVKRGEICRIIVAYGSQVGDVNFWNLHDFKEHFYSGKTRQIHRTHLSTYDRLWSCMPYLRPMATITRDSIQYGFDEDGMSIHDVIGTRCDPYMHKLMTGEMSTHSCQQYLTEAIKAYGLTEYDVHDVFNIFMCSGFHKDTHEYLIKESPAQKGDYIEFLAEMDLLVAMSTCPYGDVSLQCGVEVPDDLCFPLDVKVGRPSKELLEEWEKNKTRETK